MEENFCTPLIHGQRHFHHLGAPPPKTYRIHNRFFRFSIKIQWSFWKLRKFFYLNIWYDGVKLTFHQVLVGATMDCGPRACLNFVDFTWDNINTFAFIKYAIVCVNIDTPNILFLRHYRSVIDAGERITSAQTLAEIVCPRSDNSTKILPSKILNLTTQNLPNVLSVYANHLHSIIWLRIRSSIILSIYQSSKLQAESCFTSTLTRQIHISFQNICWCHRRASLYNLLTLIPICGGAKTGFMNIG